MVTCLLKLLRRKRLSQFSSAFPKLILLQATSKGREVKEVEYSNPTVFNKHSNVQKICFGWNNSGNSSQSCVHQCNFTNVLLTVKPNLLNPFQYRNYHFIKHYTGLKINLFPYWTLLAETA